MIDHVAECPAHIAVGFGDLRFDLLVKPFEEAVHDGLAVLLMECEALPIRHLAFLGYGIVLVDFTQGFQHMPRLLREVLHEFYEVTPPVDTCS